MGRFGVLSGSWEGLNEFMSRARFAYGFLMVIRVAVSFGEGGDNFFPEPTAFDLPIGRGLGRVFSEFLQASLGRDGRARLTAAGLGDLFRGRDG